jgi:hypothetical protein
MTGREALIAIALKYQGDWDKMVAAVKAHEEFGSEEAEKSVASLKCKCVTLIDPDYPDSLKHCFRPPLVLFYKGDLSNCSERVEMRGLHWCEKRQRLRPEERPMPSLVASPRKASLS